MDDAKVPRENSAPAAAQPLAYAPPEPAPWDFERLSRLTLILVISWAFLLLLICWNSGAMQLIVIGWMGSAVAAAALGISAWRAAENVSQDERRRGKRTLALALVPMVLTVGMVFFPSDGPRREMVHRMKCASNLRQIGHGIHLYANANAGQFPSALAPLVTHEDLPADVFVCPASSDLPATGPTTQAVVATFRSNPSHCSYVYVGAGMSFRSVSPRHVIACEHAANHAGDGMNVLYGDGHTEWLDKKRAVYLLSELKAGQNPPR
jgi:prepilin-type processing-associated H-X9-DG protein